MTVLDRHPAEAANEVATELDTWGPRPSEGVVRHRQRIYDGCCRVRTGLVSEVAR